MTRVGADPVDEAGFVDRLRPALPQMVRLAGRIAPACDSVDIAHDAVERAWRQRDRFDPGRGTRTAWLLTITASIARDAQRRAARRHALTRTWPTVPEGVYVAPDVDLEKAVQALPYRQRVAVHCFYYLDLPVADTAKVMDCSEGTVRATLNHARAALRATLGERDD